MKKIWAICSFELQRLLRKPRSYLVMFLLPLVFTLLFGNLLGDSGDNKIKLLVVDEDQSVLSASYYETVKGNKLLDVSLVSKEDAKEQLKNKKVAAAVIIPKEFQSGITEGNEKDVVFQHIPEFTSNATVRQALNNALTTIKTEVKASQSWSSYSGEPWEGMYEKLSQASAKPVMLNKETITKAKAKTNMSNLSARSAGFSIMFVMIVMMTATGAILEARKNGVWYRMMSMPASKAQILGGYILSFFILGWIQFGALMLFTHQLFDVQWGNIFGIILLVSALLLAVVGLALFIAGIVKTAEQQSSLGNIVVISTCMIAGVYWPIEIEPLFMQRIADFVPQTWAMRGFTELIARGGAAGDIVAYAGILAVFAAVFFAVGLTKIRYE
ncbi:ABC transporter permease [Ectobacillus panaciterrae]|uniref:ABC transporter permease n=1 Tax=Ectobacillus panaciterrae TaxID=363872 RepID=UPI000429C246|nr:ABC transporter permease [Ectobacillus panaciterrae]